jgi:hypothetical protein
MFMRSVWHRRCERVILRVQRDTFEWTLRFSNRVPGDFGGELEYRFTPHIGVFSEATRNVVDGPKNNFLQVNSARDSPFSTLNMGAGDTPLLSLQNIFLEVGLDRETRRCAVALLQKENDFSVIDYRL